MSFCACDDAPPTEFYRKKTRTARKKHHCRVKGCEAAICIGTRYVYVVGKSVDDNKLWDFMACLNCDEAWRRLNAIVTAANGEVCQCLDDLLESISEAFNNGYMDDKEDENVKWLMEHGYLAADTFVEDGEVAGDGLGFTDRTDLRQLPLALS